MTFQVCLTANGKPRMIVEIGPEDTVKDLYRVAGQKFGEECTDLKSGFPPKSIKPILDKVQSVLPNNDRVNATLKGSGVAKGKARNAKQSSDANVTLPTSQTTNSRVRKSQRAAAKAATDSFADVIRAQNKMMKEQQQKKRRRVGTAPPQRKPSSKTAASQKLAKLPGRRLGDGAQVGPPKLQEQRRAGGSNKFRNQEDVSYALLNSLENSGGGKVGQVLRGAMRNAITRQYDVSRAVTRVSAVQAGKYSIIATKNEQSLEPSTIQQLKIKFNKGLEGRGEFEETVDYIPRDALEAVVKAIHTSDPESLRAATLAQLSPRVFWSILKETTNSSNTIEGALQEILPVLDWSFLRRRKQALSEKAKENLRQKEIVNGVQEDNLEKAAEAVQAVEDAMEQLHTYDQTQRRNRAAHAALTRQDEVTSWSLVTPTEKDEQELLECLGGDSHFVSTLISLGIHNWRELANIDDVNHLAAQIKLENASTVEAWIDRAQEESAEEIIVEICDNNIEAVEALREEARTGTVKDLANWRSIPEMLLTSAPSLGNLKITVENIQIWCHRSVITLEQHEWLNWYATPVD